ncbi:39S ribosomal protein L38, mitochondrial [Lingula anatina]|uniref:Large ribosomal subunit protein mL38 n=1 Tax=Lingula anatina TaxID=7574 RepID=A0A1S3KIT3_LINAN|nr:39S ribosomal protein L38, mitochondrial [Lingula anatina]|eukprot:XP_013422116.1 39S ribosomal protein L38, mitochondrial [Lingula anatina]
MVKPVHRYYVQMATSVTFSLSTRLVQRHLSLRCRVDQIRWRTRQHNLPIRKRKRMTYLKRPGIPPEIAPTLEMRLADFHKSALPVEEIDIGLPDTTGPVKHRPSNKEYVEWTKNKRQYEDEARLRTLEIPLSEVQSEWEKISGPDFSVTMARHYNIFKDLFGPVYFTPRVPLDIFYELDSEDVAPVYCGNRIAASESGQAPVVQFDAPEDTLWTLVMTSPDGHLQDNTAECLHWFVGNIPGEQVDKGESICDYLPPFPPNGTGYLRYVFILYKQDKLMDYSLEKRPQNCRSLKERTFSTFKFYQRHEDYMTPAAFLFFQCCYDSSVRDVYHHILNMKEPSYEYDYPPAYRPKQVKYPHREPFNFYLDKYRDIKDINEQVLVEKLKVISPFEQYKPKKYPFMYPYKSKQSWQRLEAQNKVLHKGKWKDFA